MLFFAEGVRVFGDLFVELALCGLDGRAVEVVFEHSRVDVALAADGGCVAETLCNGADCCDEVLLPLGC